MSGLLSPLTEHPEPNNNEIWHRVRILHHKQKSWLLDPPMEKLDGMGKMWIFGCKPLIRLQWDIGEFFWQIPSNSSTYRSIPFFQYTVKLGRQNLASQSRTVLTAAELWEAHGLDSTRLSIFWKELWA
jgi:hypothetical protein